MKFEQFTAKNYHYLSNMRNFQESKPNIFEKQLRKYLKKFISTHGGKYMMVYKTRGVCSREIHFDVKDNKVVNVQYVGGCSGNTQGVARLIEGMDIDEAISRIEGIHCGPRPTSCPDQLAQALKQYKAAQQ